MGRQPSLGSGAAGDSGAPPLRLLSSCRSPRAHGAAPCCPVEGCVPFRPPPRSQPPARCLCRSPIVLAPMLVRRVARRSLQGLGGRALLSPPLQAAIGAEAALRQALERFLRIWQAWEAQARLTLNSNATGSRKLKLKMSATRGQP